MKNFYEAFERESDSDIKHHGVKGMRWGVINKQELKGGKAGGIVRGMQRSSDARSMENWTLKDKVDRMRLESDYRKLTEEEETYAATQAEKLRKAKIERVMTTVQTVGSVVGMVGGVLGLVKTFGGHPENIAKNIKAKREANKQAGQYSSSMFGNRPQTGGKSK